MFSFRNNKKNIYDCCDPSLELSQRDSSKKVSHHVCMELDVCMTQGFMALALIVSEKITSTQKFDKN